MCMFAVAAQSQDSVCLSNASEMNQKWSFYWGGKEKEKVTVKRLEQQNDTSQKVVYQFDIKPKYDSARRNQLITLLRDTLLLDHVKNEGGKLKKVRKLYSLLGLDWDSLAGIRAGQGSEEYVALLENEHTITIFKLSDTTVIVSYLKGKFTLSGQTGDNTDFPPPPPPPPDLTFPYIETLIALLAGLLMGGIITFVISRRKPALGKEHADSPYVHPVTDEVNAPVIPSGTLKILQEGIDAILKQADPYARPPHITSEENVRKLLHKCVQHFVEMAKKNSDQQLEIENLNKLFEEKREKIKKLQEEINNQQEKLKILKVEADNARISFEYEQKTHAETAQKLNESTEKIKNLELQAAQVEMVAKQIKKLVDEMYVRIDKLTSERRSHDEYKAEILKSFITISLASISYSNIRFGRYTNEDLYNMNMLAGKPPSDTSRRVGPSTIQSDVDFVAYFLYKLLDDHNASGIEGFNYKGTYV